MSCLSGRTDEITSIYRVGASLRSPRGTPAWKPLRRAAPASGGSRFLRLRSSGTWGPRAPVLGLARRSAAARPCGGRSSARPARPKPGVRRFACGPATAPPTGHPPRPGSRPRCLRGLTLCPPEALRAETHQNKLFCCVSACASLAALRRLGAARNPQSWRCYATKCVCFAVLSASGRSAPLAGRGRARRGAAALRLGGAVRGGLAACGPRYRPPLRSGRKNA